MAKNFNKIDEIRKLFSGKGGRLANSLDSSSIKKAIGRNGNPISKNGLEKVVDDLMEQPFERTINSELRRKPVQVSSNLSEKQVAEMSRNIRNNGTSGSLSTPERLSGKNFSKVNPKASAETAKEAMKETAAKQKERLKVSSPQRFSGQKLQISKETPTSLADLRRTSNGSFVNSKGNVYTQKQYARSQAAKEKLNLGVQTAVGVGVTGALVLNMFDNKGQQSNSQLYGGGAY